MRTLFSKKQIDQQRYHNADNQHRRDRDKHKAFAVFDPDIAGQFAEPADQARRITQQQADNDQNNANHRQ